MGSTRLRSFAKAMPVFFLEPFKKASFSVRPEAENIRQTGKLFQGEERGRASWTSSFQAAPAAAFVTKSIQTEKALAISRKGLIVWLPETDLNRQPSD